MESQILKLKRREVRSLHDVVQDHALPFLPAGSLHRFRSVSPSRNSKISTPYFAHTQSYSHRSLSGLFHNHPNGNGDPSPLYIPFDPSDAYNITDPFLDFLPRLRGNVHIGASSHGLVCCSSCKSQSVALNYYVCNPATKKWASIPTPTQAHEGVALVFEPSPLNFFADYHIICPFRKQEEDEKPRVTRKFEVFSSQDWEWRVSPIEMRWTPLMPDHGVSAGGKAYWRTNMSTIISFDPRIDDCEELAVPASGDAVWQLGELGSKLCCLTCVGPMENMYWTVGVFVLQEEGGETKWSEIVSFEQSGVEEVRPLMFEGEEVLLWVDRSVVSRSVAMGFSSGRLLHPPVAAAVDASECVTYISSLVDVKNGTRYN